MTAVSVTALCIAAALACAVMRSARPEMAFALALAAGAAALLMLSSDLRAAVELIVLVSLVCDWLLVMSYFDVTVMYVLLGVLAALVVCVCAYMIPLLVRYQNGLRQHLSNAMVLAVIRLPRTVAMVVMSALPLIVLVLDINVFLQTLVFWLFIGFAFIAYMNMFLYKGIYGKLEAGKK